MSPFDEDPSENRSELELCIDEIHQLQDENKRLKAKLEIARCPCGGWLEGIGIMISTQIYTYQCDKCGVRLEIARKALKEVKP